MKKIIKEGLPLLGICLGAQLIAKAAGAQVQKSPVKEIGFRDVLLTDDGLSDPIFKGLGNQLKVFQLHEDAFDNPYENCPESSNCLIS